MRGIGVDEQATDVATWPPGQRCDRRDDLVDASQCGAGRTGREALRRSRCAASRGRAGARRALVEPRPPCMVSLARTVTGRFSIDERPEARPRQTAAAMKVTTSSTSDGRDPAGVRSARSPGRRLRGRRARQVPDEGRRLPEQAEGERRVAVVDDVLVGEGVGRAEHGDACRSAVGLARASRRRRRCRGTRVRRRRRRR